MSKIITKHKMTNNNLIILMINNKNKYQLMVTRMYQKIKNMKIKMIINLKIQMINL